MIHSVNWLYVLELFAKGVGILAGILAPWVMLYLFMIGVI